LMSGDTTRSVSLVLLIIKPTCTKGRGRPKKTLGLVRSTWIKAGSREQNRTLRMGQETSSVKCRRAGHQTCPFVCGH